MYGIAERERRSVEGGEGIRMASLGEGWQGVTEGLSIPNSPLDVGSFFDDFTPRSETSMVVPSREGSAAGSGDGASHKAVVDDAPAGPARITGGHATAGRQARRILAVQSHFIYNTPIWG